MDFFSFAKHQYGDLPLLIDDEFCAGKTFIVTGSNIGLGYEAVKHLVSHGSARIIMAVRSEERGRAALSAIEAATGKRGIGQVWTLDMASYESIIAFADRVAHELDRVDGLIENATAAEGEWVIREGMESSITVNVIGTVLLAVLMMPHLKVCSKRHSTVPRLVIITSGLGFSREEDFAKIGNKPILASINESRDWTINGTERYALSKMLQMFAVWEFASLAKPTNTNVIINLVSPGFCKSGLLRYSDLRSRISVGVMSTILGRSSEWGSRCLLHGLVAGTESHGKYMAYCEIKDEWVPTWVSGEKGQRLREIVWEEVVTELDLIKPGCVKQAL